MIDENVLSPYLLYSSPFPYTENINIHPVKMKDVIKFNAYQKCLTIRKNSWFPDKNIIKMGYLSFLFYCFKNPGCLTRFNNEEDTFDDSEYYYIYFVSLLAIVCPENTVKFNKKNGIIVIDDMEVTEEIFDDIRRIIIIQNGIDFDIDEFMNYGTEKALKKAKRKLNKNVDTPIIEDYVDSLMCCFNFNEEQIQELSIRKFWRLIERINMHENYTIYKTGESSGFVTFKNPIKHWMISISHDDKYSDVITDDKTLRDKING